MHPCILPLPFIANELYSVSHFSLKYCTVFMYPCILTSLQPIVLYSVHVLMYSNLTLAHSTVQCTCTYVSYPHISLNVQCSLFMYLCTLTSLQSKVL